jgi:hypothetical protein
LKDLQFQQQSNLIDSLRLRAGYGLQINGSSNSYAPYHNGWGYDYAITNGTNLSELGSPFSDICEKLSPESIRRHQDPEVPAD